MKSEIEKWRKLFFSLFLVFLRIEISAIKDKYLQLQGLSQQFLFSVDINYYISTKAWRGSIFTAVCLCVCVSDSACEQNSWGSRTDEPIWTRFSLNGCLAHWLRSYWNWWLWIKGQGQSGTKSIFWNSLLTSLLYISALICLIILKFGMPLWYALCRFVLKFHKNQMGVTSWWHQLGFLHTNVHISNST